MNPAVQCLQKFFSLLFRDRTRIKMQIDAESFCVGTDTECGSRQRSQRRDKIDVIKRRVAKQQLPVSLRQLTLFEQHANI